MPVQVDATKLPAEIEAIVAVAVADAKKQIERDEYERQELEQRKRREKEERQRAVIAAMPAALRPFVQWAEIHHSSVSAAINVPGCAQLIFSAYMHLCSGIDGINYSIHRPGCTPNHFEDWRLALAEAVKQKVYSDYYNPIKETNGKDY